ncbi:MAG: CoA transferase [Proteobacteria bacterium]|nr:MAG: CoA transferase [Pseudomonadota bacterium]
MDARPVSRLPITTTTSEWEYSSRQWGGYCTKRPGNEGSAQKSIRDFSCSMTTTCGRSGTRRSCVSLRTARTHSPMSYVEGHDAHRFAAAAGTKPLKGLRVIDAGNMVAAPFATVLLSDFGAEVIKIEHPEYGDGQRRLEPIKDGIPLWWKNISRNKRCITLDLGRPEGAEVFRDLTKQADVVVENYRPGTFERWGLSWESLHELNKQLVMLRISGFGQTGPYRTRPAFGRVAEAMSGLSHLIGDPDGVPMSPGYPLGDLIAGVFGAFSVMVALRHRDIGGGPGQMIDLALYEAVFRLLDFDPIEYDQLQNIHTRTGNRVAYAAPSSTFRTNDGKYVTLAATTQRIWERLCRAIEREDLLDDPRFVDNPRRVLHSEEINGVVERWIGARTRDEVTTRLDSCEVPHSAIYDISDAFRDAQYLAREAMVRVTDPDLGEAVVQNVVPKFSTTPGAIEHLGASMGAHNEEIYGGLLKYPREKIRRLKEEGVI